MPCIAQIFLYDCNLANDHGTRDHWNFPLNIIAIQMVSCSLLSSFLGCLLFNIYMLLLVRDQEQLCSFGCAFRKKKHLERTIRQLIVTAPAIALNSR
jgi:hypothetical protein